MSIALRYRTVSSPTRLAYFFITLGVAFFCLFLLSGCVSSPPVSVSLAHPWPVAVPVINPLDAQFDRAVRFAGEVVRSFPDDKPLTAGQAASQARWMVSDERRADLEALASWPSLEVQSINWQAYR